MKARCLRSTRPSGRDRVGKSWLKAVNDPVSGSAARIALQNIERRRYPLDIEVVGVLCRRAVIDGFVTLPCGERECRRLKNLGQAAATAVRHVSIAAARSVRCV